MKKKLLLLLSFLIFVPALVLAAGQYMSPTLWLTQGGYNDIVLNCGDNPDPDEIMWTWYDSLNPGAPIDNTDQYCPYYDEEFSLSSYFSWNDLRNLTPAGALTGYIIWHSTANSCVDKSLSECLEVADYGSQAFIGISPL